jgi:hypothetical protein
MYGTDGPSLSLTANCVVYDRAVLSQLSSGLASVITCVMTDKDRGVVATGQPGDRLYKQILFIAAFECVAAFLCL